MLNWIFAWWLIGIAWFVVEFTHVGGAKALIEHTRKELSYIRPSLIPLATFVISLVVIALIVVMAFVWPHWVWHDWKNGKLFKPGRWDE